MIPTDWIPHRRGDREVVGYVREHGEGFQAMDLFGRPLGEPTDWLGAEEALEEQGLAWLAEPFVLEVDGRDVRVRIVEVTPERIRVKSEDFGDIGASLRFWEVPVPETGRLRAAPPLSEWPG